MTSPSLAIQATAVVIRGEFNPAIITPGWLLAQGLLGAKEALVVHSQVILNQLSQFHVSWLQFQATEEQLSATTDEPAEFERLRDVVVGVLETLPHTPVSALGINRMFHFQMPSWEEWHTVGDRLVPKPDLWNDILHLPGTETVAVQGARSDEYAGRVLVTVQPSKVVQAGIFVSVNDHYVLETVEMQPQTRVEARMIEAPTIVEPSSERIPTAVEILNKRWIESIDSAEEMAQKVVGLARG